MMKHVFSMLLVLVSACGDDAGSAESCEAFEACGGDPIGRWEIVSTCGLDLEANANATQFDEPECDEAFQNVEVTASGTYEFSSSGTVTIDTVAQVDLDVLLTEECVAATRGAAPVNFAEYCRGLESQYTQTSDFAGAVCAVEGAACACLLTTADQAVMETRPYVVDGVNLDDGSTLTPFCVQGDRLATREESPDGNVVVVNLKRVTL